MIRFSRRTWRLLLSVGLASVLLAGLSGCGCSSCSTVPDTYWGDVYVDNTTDLVPPTSDMLTFQLAPVGLGFSANLLSAVLPPGFEEFVGTWNEDYYDGYATLANGDTVDWPSIWVGGAGEFVFDIVL